MDKGIIVLSIPPPRFYIDLVNDSVFSNNIKEN